MSRMHPKGKIAEREVAKLIGAWWSSLEPEARFVRTPQSGGWHGAEVRTEFRASGDLMTTAKRFPFTVEVKRREAWSHEVFLAGKASPVWDWWRQAQGQARELSAEPALFFRQNRAPVHLFKGERAPVWNVMLREEYVDVIYPPAVGVTRWSHEGPILACNFGEHWPALVSSETLFNIPPFVFAL
jgi:hypothetical protein